MRAVAAGMLAVGCAHEVDGAGVASTAAAHARAGRIDCGAGSAATRRRRLRRRRPRRLPRQPRCSRPPRPPAADAGRRPRRGWTRPRQPAAAADTAAGGDAGAGHADRVGDDAEPRPAGGSGARPVGRRPGRVEHEAGLDHAAVGEVPRRDQLRPGVHRQVRHPGQLQRLPGLRHLESGRSRPRC